MRKLLQFLALLTALAGAAWAQGNYTETITVTNSPSNITISNKVSSVVVRENSAGPTAVFSITPAASGSAAVNQAAGTEYSFCNGASQYAAGAVLGTIQATTSGPFTFVLLESNGPCQTSRASKAGSSTGSGVSSLSCVAPLNCSGSTGTVALGIANPTGAASIAGWPVYDQGAIPGSLDASDVFFANSLNNCGTGLSEDIGCAINNALRSPNNKTNVITAAGFGGRYANNLLPTNFQMTHGFTGSNFTLILPGYLLTSVPQWGLRQKQSIIGTGIPYSTGVSPYGPAIGGCGPGSPASAGYNATTHACTPVGSSITVPQFPDTTNPQTFGIKFNVAHGPFPAGSYYPVFIACGMDASGEGSGFLSDCIGNEMAHIAFEGGGNDTTNDPTLGTGLIVFYNENIDVRDEWHDLIFANFGGANAVNAVGQMIDRREAPTGQAGPARFSERDSNFASNLTNPSTSTYGFMYLGENITIEFPTQGGCAQPPSAVVLSANNSGVTSYKITGNGGSGCSNPTCNSIQAGNSLSLSGNLVTNATNSSSSCTPIITSGVITSLTFGTGSGYNPSVGGTGPYSLSDMSMTGNGQAFQDFMYIEGTANPVLTAIHGETGSGYTLHLGAHAAVLGGTFNGIDGTAGIGGVVELDLGADDTQQFQSVNYISSTPSPAIVDLVNGCTLSGYVAVYGPGHGCNPAQYNTNLGATAATQTFANDPTTGTQLGRGVKITSTGAITASNTDPTIDGICVSGCGTTGSANFAWAGQASCSYDNAVTEGHFVQLSASGQCHDTGSAVYPTTGGVVVGKVTLTNGSTGTYLTKINLQSPSAAVNLQPVTDGTAAIEILKAGGTVIGTVDTTNTRLRFGDATAPSATFDIAGKFKVAAAGNCPSILGVATGGLSGCVGDFTLAAGDQTGLSANLAATTILGSASVAAGTYRVSVYESTTTVGTTFTLPTVCVLWTDADNSTVFTQIAAASVTGTTSHLQTQGSVTINAKAATNIQFATGATVCTGGSSYASSGTAMVYKVRARVEAN